MFQLQNKFKTTWMHPRSKIWHLLDYVIVRRNGIKDVKITRAMRGADGWTDHRLLRSILHLKILPPTRRQAPKKHLDLKALNIDATRSPLQTELSAHITLPAPTEDPISTEYLTEKWDNISEVLLNTAKDVLGFSRRRHRDWFDEQCIRSLVPDVRYETCRHTGTLGYRDLEAQEHRGTGTQRHRDGRTQGHRDAGT
ncbi:uncharacterized protein LOC143025789 [Oratosquilla oratoria]|uniref:uncharacterized protein LOC143025789 n=1 Tax=Oratosquilla oratoria TaxID=337810 RepID=UPI003F759720